MEPATFEGFRLSPQQKHLFALSSGGEWPFLVQTVVEIDGVPDVERLRLAADRVAGRWEVLRTTFARLPGMGFPVQVVGGGGVEWEEREVAARSGLDPVLEEALSRPFALESGPLLRMQLVSISPAGTVLVLTVPAVTADPAAVELLLAELVREYAGEEDGEEAIQYIDLSEWQNDLLEAEDTAAGREFWERGVGAAPDPRLPFEAPGTSEAFRPCVVGIDLAPEAAREVERAGSPTELLLACWQVLLARATGEPSQVTGVLSSGRKFDELKRAPGLFARHLPVRAEVDPAAPFASLVRAATEAREEAERYGEYFSWDVPGGPAPEGEGQRFFSFCFAYREAPAPLAAAGVRFLASHRAAVLGRFVAELTCTRAGGTLRAELAYDALRLPREAAERLLEGFVQVVEGAVRDPAAAVGSLEAVGPREREWLLRGLNDTGQGFAAEPVHRAIERWAARVPEREALRDSRGAASYAEVEARANRLAHHLAALGVRTETLVAVGMERTAEAVVALLAVLKAGGAYLPLDPSLPDERLRRLLESSGASVLLADGARLASLAPGGVLAVDPGAAEVAARPSTAPATSVDPGNLAYVLFTSGSTGEPKGVAVQHGALANYVLGVTERLGLEEGMSFATVSTFAADLGNTVVFPALTTGGTLHVVPQDVAADPAGFGSYAAEHPIDVLKIVPSHLGAMMQGGTGILPRRRLVLGGEALPPDLADRVLRAAPGCQLFNHYGPTETTVGVCTHGPVESVGQGATLPIGRPLPNCRLYVLDGHLHPVPAGAAGELYVGGAQVARGYPGRPAATAERFLPDPYATAGARMYRTGDRARQLPDGSVEFLGRADDQVKIRGFRVEPREVEAVLRTHPGLADAAVVPRRDAAGAMQLVAYMVPSAERAGTVRRFLEMIREEGAGSLGRHELPDGTTVFHLNPGETDFLYDEIFRQRTYLRHGITLPPSGAVVLDVGANIGLFSLLVGRMSRAARVHAFEPIPPVARLLRANLRLHGVEGKVHECGLAAEGGTAPFTYYPHLSLVSGRYADPEAERQVVRAFEGGRVLAEGGEQPSGTLLEEMLDERLSTQVYDVELKSLSRVMRAEGIGRVDLLKVDVQRAELDVLSGIEPAEWAGIRQVVAEVHDEDGRLARVVSLLEEQGFRVTVEQEHGLENTVQYDVYALRPDAVDAGGAAPSAAGMDEEDTWRSVERLEQAVHEHARARLPEAMMPAAWVLLERLPITENGKLDRAALPDPEEVAARNRHVEPRTPTERALASIWEELLRVPRVGAHDNFFELGGHSLLVTQLVSRIRRILKADLSFRSLFEAPTLAGMAEVVDAAPALQEEADAPRIARVERGSRAMDRSSLS